MNKIINESVILIICLTLFCIPDVVAKKGAKIADKPLFRDTKYDGAADPVIIWNKKE